MTDMFRDPPTLRAVLAGAGPEDESALGTVLAGSSGSPWYVRLLVAGMAWLSALAITGFLTIAEIITEASALGWGLAAAVVAIALARRGAAERAGPRAEFQDQLALVFSLLARILVFVGAGEMAQRAGMDPQVASSLALLPLEVVFGATMEDGLQRFLAAGLSGVWLLAALDGANLDPALEVGLQEGVAVIYAAATGLLLLAGSETRSGRFGAAPRPLAYGGATFVIGAVGLLSIDGLLEEVESQGLVLTGGLAILGALLLVRVLGEVGRPALGGAGVAMGFTLIALALGSRYEPGILASLGLLMLAFRSRDRLLLGLAVVALAAFVWHFYYSLRLDFLSKSAVLLGSGLVLLLVRQLLLRRPPSPPPPAEALP